MRRTIEVLVAGPLHQIELHAPVQPSPWGEVSAVLANDAQIRKAVGRLLKKFPGKG